MKKGLSQEQLDWLYSREWFSNYRNNCERAGTEIGWTEYKTGDLDPRNIILGAFQWSSTPEGLEYWRKAHLKWLEYLDTIKD